MSSGEDDILFRIGFESHPQAGAKLEALAKSVESLQVRLDQSMRRVGDRAIAEAARVNTVTGGGTAGGGGGSPASTAAAARQMEHAKELDADRHFRQAMARSGQLAFMTVQQQNDALRIAGEAKLTIQRQQAEQTIVLMEQLQKDLELVQKARDGNAGDADIGEVIAANERIHALHQQAEEAREREAAAEEKARKEQARADEKANREAIKAREVRAREFQRLAKEEVAEERDALRAKQAVHREREAMARDQQRLAADAARPWLDAYAQEVQAAEAAARQIARGRQQLFGSLSRMAEGLGQLSRSAVLLGLANGEQMEKVIRQLALVQAGIDLVRGGASVIRGVGQAFEAVRMILLGRIAAERAAQAAGRLSVAGSAAVTQALNLEAIAANRTALAHHMLARARGGGGAVGGAVASATGSAIGSAAGGVGTAAAGGGIGAAVVAGIKSAGAYIGTALGAVITAPVAIAAAGAVVAGGAAYYVMTKGDRDAASESEETTKRVEHWSKLFQLEQGHLQKLARIREGAEQQRASLARSVSDASFEDRMGLMRTPGEKLSAMDGRVSALTLERNAAAARVSANTEIDANTGAPRLNEDGQQMLEELIAAEERLLDAEKTRYALTREIEGEKRKLRMDEIKGIEDIIRSRQKERDELEKGYQTAKERFGALDRVDQKKALGALEKARSGADLTRTDLDRLRNIGTDESDQFIRDANNKSAEKAGFDVANRGAIDAKQMAIDEANNASIATLAAQPGQSEKEIRENLAKPVKVDLVNYETLNVQLNQEENVLFDKVVAEIQRLRKQQAESLERRIQEAEFAKIEEATNEYRTSVGGIQN